MQRQTPERYRRPGWVTQHVLNPMVSGMVRVGLGLRGARVLEVKGRSTGQWRRTPVNPLYRNGAWYLVAPRGNTQWVRNLRADPKGRVRLGRHVHDFTAVELSNDDKVPVLRDYLKRWKMEVGTFFAVGPDASDEELARVAPDHPVFRIE